MKVRLAGIVNESVNDGPGLRIVLFFQGCNHHCPGCHNPQTWSFSGGEEYDVDTLLADLKDNPLIRGITLSGGDPFYQPKAAARIAANFHERGKDVWAYTGFEWAELISQPGSAWQELIEDVDVLVDGPFLQEQRDLNLPFRGSANQHLICVSQSVQENKIIFWNRTPQ
jgi:anaerobic ribonucleoside-triphosphate reductase activating protein